MIRAADEMDDGELGNECDDASALGMLHDDGTPSQACEQMPARIWPVHMDETGP